jgi:hypothetical protein
LARAGSIHLLALLFAQALLLLTQPFLLLAQAFALLFCLVALAFGVFLRTLAGYLSIFTGTLALPLGVFAGTLAGTLIILPVLVPNRLFLCVLTSLFLALGFILLAGFHAHNVVAYGLYIGLQGHLRILQLFSYRGQLVAQGVQRNGDAFFGYRYRFDARGRFNACLDAGFYGLLNGLFNGFANIGGVRVGFFISRLRAAGGGGCLVLGFVAIRSVGRGGRLLPGGRGGGHLLGTALARSQYEQG